MHGIMGRPGAMIDACIVMTFCLHMLAKVQYTHTVLSVQAAVQLHE